MEIVLKVLLALGGVIVCTLAVVGVQYLTRGTNVRRLRAPGDSDGPPAPTDPLFCDTLALLTKTSIVPGHRIEIFTNGDETYPRLWADLRSAERSISLQMYYVLPGKMADEFKSILLERAAAGVRVFLLRDAIGSLELPEAYLTELREGGVEVATFRPTRWYQLFKVYHRSHIRVAVIDGAIGYTGGFGIDDRWWGDGKSEDHWRDTNVRFTGPAVLQHQATFAAGWAEATGNLLSGDLFFPLEAGTTRGEGDLHAGLLHAAPTVGSTSAERYFALAIGSARRRLFITNPYFVPSENFCEMLAAAAKRGVDVRVLTSGDKTDVQLTHYASRARYEALLAAGVRIFEYAPTMIHAKTIVGDGRFVSIGTINFDNRSMSFNDETTLLAVDNDLGAQLEAIFERDMGHSREFTLDDQRARPALERLRERGATMLTRVL